MLETLWLLKESFTIKKIVKPFSQLCHLSLLLYGKRYIDRQIFKKEYNLKNGTGVWNCRIGADLLRNYYRRPIN